MMLIDVTKTIWNLIYSIKWMISGTMGTIISCSWWEIWLSIWTKCPLRNNLAFLHQFSFKAIMIHQLNCSNGMVMMWYGMVTYNSHIAQHGKRYLNLIPYSLLFSFRFIKDLMRILSFKYIPLTKRCCSPICMLGSILRFYTKYWGSL